MNPSDVLLAAADLIETRGWTQDYYAKDSTGRFVEADDPAATCFCVTGALIRVTPESEYAVAGEARKLLSKFLDRKSKGVDWNVPIWNDAKGQTAEAVVKTMREAAQSVTAGETT